MRKSVRSDSHNLRFKEIINDDKKSASTTNRPGLHQALDHAREGDVIVVHTLDRLGRTVRDTWPFAF
nr:recombinase family protein [Corynebacterium alimapuense]